MLVRGMEAMLGRRREALQAGERGVGWKIGINDPGVQAHLGLDAPVVGFMTTGSALPDEGAFPVGGTTFAVAEPEVAIEVDRNLGADADLESARAAIVALAPALEVVDVDLPFDDIEPILAGNIFHRAVAFGEWSSARSVDGIAGRVLVNGEVRHPVDAAAALGDPGATVLHVAHLLAAHGELLRSGERIIAGSMTPPVAVSPGDEVRLELDRLGTVALSFVD